MGLKAAGLLDWGPTAIAGGTGIATELRDNITLNGDGSSEDATNFYWEWIRGGSHSVEIDTPNKSRIFLQAPEVKSDSDIVFQLRVSNTWGKSTDNWTIRILNQNQRPNITLDKTLYEIDENTMLRITPKIDDIDSDPSGFTYEWTREAGPENLKIYGEDTSSALIQAPAVDSDTDAVLSFKVYDEENSPPATEPYIPIKIRNTDNIANASYVPSRHTIGFTPLIYELGSGTALRPVSVQNNSNLNSGEPGIKMIYPTKENGQVWVLGKDNNRSKMFDGSVVKYPDESWKIKATSDNPSENEVSYYVYTTDYAAEPDIKESDHSMFAKNGHIFDSTDWTNVEVTTYIKINDISNENQYFAINTRGLKHNDKISMGCLGTSYRNQLSYDGNLQFRKEQWHPFFVSSDFSNIGSIIGEWVGLKFIVYNMEDATGKQVVKMETYVDKSGKGNIWVKIDERIDDGNWGDAGQKCGGSPDQIITWGAPAINFLFRGIPDVDIKNFSVREIQPPV